MLKHTEAAIRAILEADPSVTPDQIKAGLNAINGTGRESITDTRPVDTILKPGEVAAILKTTKRNVGRYGRLGVLRRVRVPGLSRALGYSADSVRAFMAGKMPKPKAGAAK